MEMQVGSFYEINHALLAVTKHPEQLKLIRVVMLFIVFLHSWVMILERVMWVSFWQVSEKTKVSVSLRFPSIYSLRMHFNNSNTNRTREGTKKLPPLDEKYVISSDVAAQLLLKRVSATELTEKKDSWSFWTMTSSSCSSPTVSTSTATSPPPPPLAPGLAKKGTCWSQLKCSGMVRWGKRRQVQVGGAKHAEDTERKGGRVWESNLEACPETGGSEVDRGHGKEAGVQDPYWTPPPGWKLGDSPSQDPVCAREIKFLREEIAKLKGEMQELISKKQEEILTPVTIKPTDQERIGLPPKEMYTELIRKKSAMEEQLKEISRYLSMMKLMQEDMESLKSTVGETRVSELEEPITPVGTEAGGGERMKVGEEKDKVADDAVAAMVPMEEDEVEENMKRTRTAAEDKAAKIQRLKSGFRICKPQGTFLWPSMAMSSLSPHYAVEDLLVVPTPPSAPSSPPSHHQLQPSNGLVGAAQPTSPVKPLAEKRMLSVAAPTPEMAQSPTETPKATTPTPSRNPAFPVAEGAFVAIGSFSPAKKPSASPLVQQEHSKGTNDTANATPEFRIRPRDFYRLSSRWPVDGPNINTEQAQSDGLDLGLEFSSRAGQHARYVHLQIVKDELIGGQTAQHERPIHQVISRGILAHM
ncbi:hypothetical protein CRG98_040367 [Punica granatum]|uniref:Uncharacterized protein n=1 Tax=Punica granatum TaxID=22663 RepID=A0A2I0I5I1_PUNGR|nr:hypothetical protein CRG98_040367 [Punica granatum]